MALDTGFQLPASPPPLPVDRRRPTLIERVVALIEVILCSDYPTQFALASTFATFGYRPIGANGHLVVGYVALLSLLDTALLISLILLFLRAHSEHPRDFFLGPRPPWGEAVIGLSLTIVALAIGVAVLAGIQRFAPSLHNVAQNPLQDLIRTPRDAWLFAIVVVVAGGIREEIQRAFLLRRFEGSLGGAAVGVVVTSIMFGAGHQLQGTDAAIATGVLGAFWAVVYLRRRSSVAPLVSHSGFNVLRIGQFLIAGS
jgi:membrane protease YdiL (CAAX protease family)